MAKASRWYEHRHPGLGGDFLRAVDSVIARIRNTRVGSRGDVLPSVELIDREEERRLLPAVRWENGGGQTTHPGAAASLREGLTATLTLERLGVNGALYRTLRSTNVIENLNRLVGHFTRNVRRWRDGAMLVRWMGAALQDAQPRLRHVKSCRDMPTLIRALDRHQVDTKKEVA